MVSNYIEQRLSDHLDQYDRLDDWLQKKYEEQSEEEDNNE